MKIIADSSASRTEWALVDGATVVEHAFTKGLNPFFHTRRDISHSIRLELPEAFSSVAGSESISMEPAVRVRK